MDLVRLAADWGIERPARLIQTLDRGEGSRGQVAARAAVASLAGNPWSVAEGRAHELLRLAGITGWVRI